MNWKSTSAILLLYLTILGMAGLPYLGGPVLNPVADCSGLLIGSLVTYIALRSAGTPKLPKKEKKGPPPEPALVGAVASPPPSNLSAAAEPPVEEQDYS